MSLCRSGQEHIWKLSQGTIFAFLLHFMHAAILCVLWRAPQVTKLKGKVFQIKRNISNFISWDQIQDSNSFLLCTRERELQTVDIDRE